MHGHVQVHRHMLVHVNVQSVNYSSRVEICEISPGLVEFLVNNGLVS